MSLLDYFEMRRFEVPQPARAWAAAHTNPDHALEQASMPHLVWLAGCCNSSSGEIARVLTAATHAQAIYHRAQRAADDLDATSDSSAEAELRDAVRTLRATLRETRWWQTVQLSWEHWYTCGLRVHAYVIALGCGRMVPVRGTAVGRHAVREVSVSELAGLVAALPARRHLESITTLYAIDHADFGYSIGTFASAAVAFWIAARFDRARDGEAAKRLWSITAHYRGTTISGYWRSWPAQPPKFARHP